MRTLQFPNGVPCTMIRQLQILGCDLIRRLHCNFSSLHELETRVSNTVGPLSIPSCTTSLSAKIPLHIYDTCLFFCTKANGSPYFFHKTLDCSWVGDWSILHPDFASTAIVISFNFLIPKPPAVLGLQIYSQAI